jgi:hypothetical protein
MKEEELSKAIEEFKVIYYQKFGIQLSNEEASIKAIAVLQLFDCLITKEILE